MSSLGGRGGEELEQLLSSTSFQGAFSPALRRSKPHCHSWVESSGDKMFARTSGSPLASKHGSVLTITDRHASLRLTGGNAEAGGRGLSKDSW